MGADMGADIGADAAMNDGMLERIARDWNRDAVSNRARESALIQ